MTGVPAASFDSALLRKAFAAFPSGVTAVCALVDETATGMAASSFTSVSLDPPLVSVCVARTSTTWPALRERPAIGISVLAEDHAEISRALAAKDGDRFAGVEWVARESGAILVDGSALWLECVLSAELPAGDHTVALFEIRAMTVFEDVSPLVFHGSRFRRLGI